MSDRDPVRVVHVVLELDSGGLENLVAEMAVRFAGSDIEMSVVTLDGREGRIGRRIRDRLAHLQVLRPIRLLSLIAPVRLAGFLRQIRADVVHVHSGAWYIAARAARNAAVPMVVYTEHGLLLRDHLLGGWIRRMAGRHTDYVVTVSETLERALAQEFPVLRARIRTIRNGVDVAAFSPGSRSETLMRELRIPAGAQVIGAMGRLDPVKAYDRLIRAFACACARRPEAVKPFLVLCGDGPERGRLQGLARDLDVALWVRFPGWVEDPVSYYRLFDVFVLSSLSEGAPLSLLEAMSTGVVPVATAVGANEDILGHDLRGQIVRGAAPEDLAAVLERTLSTPEHLVELQKRARRRVQESYNVEAMVAEYRSLYRQSRGRRRPDESSREERSVRSFSQS